MYQTHILSVSQFLGLFFLAAFAAIILKLGIHLHYLMNYRSNFSLGLIFYSVMDIELRMALSPKKFQFTM